MFLLWKIYWSVSKWQWHGYNKYKVRNEIRLKMWNDALHFQDKITKNWKISLIQKKKENPSIIFKNKRNKIINFSDQICWDNITTLNPQQMLLQNNRKLFFSFCHKRVLHKISLGKKKENPLCGLWSKGINILLFAQILWCWKL